LSIGPNPNQAFLYVTSSGQILPSTQTTPSVSGYSVNSSTGALVEVPGSPFFLQGSSPASNSSLSIVGFEASGRFAYVTANTAGSMAVHGLSADASTGTLTALPSSPFTFVSDGSASVPGVFDATAKHFYVPHGSSNGAVAVFDFDSTTGALMPNSVPAVPTGGNTPLFASRHPSGRYLYVTNLGSNSIAHFNLDATTGILTSINGSPVATGGAFPVYATVHPTGRFVFAANSNFATINGGIPTVAAFDVDQTTGALRPVAGSPFPTGGSNALGDTSLCVVEPRGRFLYVSNSGSNSITAFSIDQTTGALSAVTGSPFATGARPSTVVPDPSGKFLYAVNRDAGSVSSYMIDAVTGALTLVSTQPTGTTPLSVLVFGLR
jgi:6-phosphogluconolactonase (cycloisomerase 2 family)